MLAGPVCRKILQVGTLYLYSEISEDMWIIVNFLKRLGKNDRTLKKQWKFSETAWRVVIDVFDCCTSTLKLNLSQLWTCWTVSLEDAKIGKQMDLKEVFNYCFNLKPSVLSSKLPIFVFEWCKYDGLVYFCFSLEQEWQRIAILFSKISESSPKFLHSAAQRRATCMCNYRNH